MAAFTAIMMLLSWAQGFKAGKRFAARQMFRTLGVPDDAEIVMVEFRQKKNNPEEHQ